MRIDNYIEYYDNSSIRNKRNKRFVGQSKEKGKAAAKTLVSPVFFAVWKPAGDGVTRRQGDLETAQQVLGHSSKQTTERHYAHVDLSRAEANALQYG